MSARGGTLSHSQKVVVGIPCLLVGGTEHQTLLLVKVLRESGRDVEVCCYFEHDAAVVERFHAAGCRVTVLGWDRALPACKVVAGLRRFFRSARPDVVHIQYLAPGFLPILAARLAGGRYVFATVHQLGSSYGWRERWVLRIAAALCTRFVCVSEAVEESWFGRRAKPGADGKPSRILSIPNALDLDDIDRIRRSVASSKARKALGLGEEPVVGAIARLSPEKGVDVLIRAFERVIATFQPGARLLIVGDGPERARLLDLARELGMGERVVWAGGQPWDKAIEYLAAMDVVAVPSRKEGFGLTAAEAMACEKPVVASAIGGLRQVVVNDQTGYMMKPEDLEAFVTNLGKLIADGELRASMGKAGRLRAERIFSLSAWANRVAQLYEEFS